MGSKFVSSLCTFLVSFLCMNHAHSSTTFSVMKNGAVANGNSGTIFSVTNYGAAADGNKDNSVAFTSAWKAACETSGGVVSVPPGTYLVKGAAFEGPCKGQTLFQNEGTIRASPGGSTLDYWLMFSDVVGLQIYGRGTFDGNGASAWETKKSCKGDCGTRPVSIKILKVKSLAIKGITSLNSKQFHFHIALCEDVVMSNVNIKAPGESPNTDGIHIGRSTGVRILNSKIATGDDCVSIGDGSENINIESVTCGPGHGFSIGSLGKYQDEKDVRGITVKDCTLINTSNGLRIKTWAPSSVASTVSNVTFENINFVNVGKPIFIDQHYCPESGCSHSQESKIKIDGVKFINVKGTAATPVAVELGCSKSAPCQNVEFEELGITTAGGRSTAAVCTSASIKFATLNQTPNTCGKASEVASMYDDEEAAAFDGDDI